MISFKELFETMNVMNRAEIAEGYTGRETKDGTWHVFKTGRAVAVAGPFKSREEASAWITKKSMSEEVQLEEAKIPVEHAVKAVTRVLGSVSAAKFATHLRPGTEKHTTWDKVNTALKNQGVKPQHIAKIAVHTRPAQYEEVEIDEAVSVEHDRYMRSHGKKASGSGNWMFTHKRAGDVDYKNDKEVHQARGSFADAAKSAKAWAKSHGHSTVYVMEEVELDESKSTASKPYYRIVGTISPELKKRLSAADEKRRENARQLMQRPTKPTSEESQKEEVEGLAEAQSTKTGIYQTDVLGAKAYHAKCMEPNCKWESKRFDRIKQAQAAAEKHAKGHFKQGVAEEVESIDEVSKELANRVSTARRKQADASSAKDPYLKPSAETIAKKKKADQAHSSWIKRMFRDNNRGKTQADISRDHAAVADQNYKRGWSNEEVEIDEVSSKMALNAYQAANEKSVKEPTFAKVQARRAQAKRLLGKFQEKSKKEREAPMKEEAEIDEAIDFKKAASKHMKDLHDKNSTPANKAYAQKMLQRALEASKMKDKEAATKHYMMGEESEHLDELSKPTLGKYIRLASRDASRAAGSRELHKKLGQDQYAKEAEKARKKRQAGIDKATQRLTAEDNEVQEKILSFGEFITK